MMNAAPSSASEEVAFASAAATTAVSAAPIASRTRTSRAFELVRAMTAVAPAKAIAATRPGHPSAGNVTVNTNVARIRRRTSP
jgi:hypothetical protein